MLLSVFPCISPCSLMWSQTTTFIHGIFSLCLERFNCTNTDSIMNNNTNYFIWGGGVQLMLLPLICYHYFSLHPLHKCSLLLSFLHYSSSDLLIGSTTIFPPLLSPLFFGASLLVSSHVSWLSPLFFLSPLSLSL